MEAYGTAVVGTVIVNQGTVVRPSQLIASVSPTRRGSVSDSTMPTSDPSEGELRAAVGPRADFYLRKWQATEGGGFNWAAFFMSGLWLPYRKMYRATLALYAFVLLESAGEELIFIGWLGQSETPRFVERGVTAAICWICGALGNRWYLRHVRARIARARTRQSDDQLRLELLRSDGGTSVVRALLCFIAFLVLIVGSLVGVETLLERMGHAG